RRESTGALPWLRGLCWVAIADCFARRHDARRIFVGLLARFTADRFLQAKRCSARAVEKNRHADRRGCAARRAGGDHSLGRRWTDLVETEGVDRHALG